MEFLHLDAGNILTILTFVIGGLGFVYTIRGDVKASVERIAAVEKELYELRKVVVQIARQEERLNYLDQRIIAQGLRLDDAQKEIRIVRRKTPEEIFS